MGEWCCRVYLVGISAVVVLLSAAEAEALSTDGLALLALKSAVSADPTGALDTWRDSDADPCGWVGVTCGDGRVTDLALPNRSLSGYLPSELSLLSALSSLSLPSTASPAPSRRSRRPPRPLRPRPLPTSSPAHPPAIGALASLSRLDLSSNLLSGSLPPAIAALPRLSGVLNLSCNRFSGPIPPEFGSIPVDVSLDLRRNNLSGEIPQVGSLLNQGPTAFAGNPGLCGSATTDPVRAERQHRRPGVAVPILAGVVVAALASIVILQLHFRRRRRGSAGDGKESKKGKGGAADGALAEDRRDAHEGDVFVAVDEGFGLELEELLRASAYVVGKSRGGIVYKVVTGKGPAVAVRRLSEGDDGESGGGDEWRRRRGFESEAMAIGRARHPNVVRLLAYYYAPDEKLLVYDYIPNGTLHAALHGWVRRAFKEERPLSEVVDPALLHEVHAKKQVLAVFHVALGCTEVDPELRPRMRAVSESLDRIG
uniref:Protein kinase domain-containing protein n=1 Tax=Ananas comosus var. bracteatus TaxID=296719 RepID=A0A6V7QXL9_ANACO